MEELGLDFIKERFGDLLVTKLSFKILIQEEPNRERSGSEGVETFWGSAWRGLLGWGLQELACPMPARRDCDRCVILEQCPCHILFGQETPIPGLKDSPRGYIIYPQDRGDFQELSITLIGRESRFATIITEALRRGEERGIGKGKAHYRLLSKRTVRSSLKECLEKSLRLPKGLNLRTPLRLRQKEHYLGAVEWPFFLETIARRIEALNAIYGGGTPIGKELWNKLKCLFDDAPKPSMQDLHWFDYKRYSSRQSKKIPMGGLVGKVYFQDAPDWFWAWVKVAEIVHVGKGTSMGLGKVEIL